MKKRNFKPPPDTAQIHELIHGLFERHILKNSPQNYIDDFVMAVLEVYDHAELAKILQAKFFLPNESNYTDEAYYQSASELSVARYIKQKEKQKLVTGFRALHGRRDSDGTGMAGNKRMFEKSWQIKTHGADQGSPQLFGSWNGER